MRIQSAGSLVIVTTNLFLNTTGLVPQNKMEALILAKQE
mgnify:FL=1